MMNHKTAPIKFKNLVVPSNKSMLNEYLRYCYTAESATHGNNIKKKFLCIKWQLKATYKIMNDYKKQFLKADYSA